MVAKGSVLDSLPDAPLPIAAVRQVESHPEIRLAKPLPGTTADPAEHTVDTTGEDAGDGYAGDDVAETDGAETTRRIALRTATGGYVVEYLPPNGWVVIRSVPASGRGEEDIEPALRGLIEETPSGGTLNALMREGYDLLDTGDTVAACDRWLEVWEGVKQRVTAELTSIRDAEVVFSGTELLFNWCQDFEMQLANAGNTDDSYYEHRIDYGREFCELFPESKRSIRQSMRGSVGESLFCLGHVEEAERVFESLMADHPGYGWGYLLWGDAYRDSQYELVPADIDRAEELYRHALDVPFDDEVAVWNRLDGLAAERADDHAEPSRRD